MLRYARVPSNLPTSCDSCGESKKFNVNHALDCKKGGLVTARHNGSRDELRDLLAQLFSPSRIRCEPMINPAPMRANGTKTHVPSASSSSSFLNADRGDLLIRGFWEGSTDTIIDVRLTNADRKPRLHKELCAYYLTTKCITLKIKNTDISIISGRFIVVLLYLFVNLDSFMLLRASMRPRVISTHSLRHSS